MAEGREGSVKPVALDAAMVLWREMDDLARMRRMLASQILGPERILLAVNDPNEESLRAIPFEKPWESYTGPNTGYAGGLERVWRRGSSEWILCLNTDLDLSPDTVERFLKVAEAAPAHVGAIGPKVLYPDGRLQSAGGLQMGPEGICRPRGIGEEDQGQYDHHREVPLLSGCCLLLRRSMLEDVGGFDAGFFMYLEEVDLLLRALWAGWTCRYEPSIRVVHRHGASAGRYSTLQMRLLERNHWYVLPQLPSRQSVRAPLYTLERWGRMAMGQSAAVQPPWFAPFLALAATVEGVAGLPRRFLRRTPRRISEAQWEASFRGHTLTMKQFLALP